MFEYPFDRTGAINSDELIEELSAAVPGVEHRTEPGKVIVLSSVELTTQQQDALEAVITNHDPSPTPAQQVELDREAARLLLVEAKEYLRTQLESASPSTAQQQVGIIKPTIDSNLFLTGRMTKLIGLANTAYGWSLVISPAAQPNFSRWLEVFIQMVSIET